MAIGFQLSRTGSQGLYTRIQGRQGLLLGPQECQVLHILLSPPYLGSMPQNLYPKS